MRGAIGGHAGARKMKRGTSWADDEEGLLKTGQAHASFIE